MYTKSYFQGVVYVSDIEIADISDRKEYISCDTCTGRIRGA